MITFTGSATDPSQRDTASGFTFFWQFGDGRSATGSTVTHSYTATGTFAVTLKATEKSGLFGTGSTTADITKLTATANTAAVGVENGLTGYWKLDDTALTGSIVDSSGHSYTGTGVSFASPYGPSTSVPPGIGFTDAKSRSFNGTTSHVTLPGAAAVSSHTAFSVSLWAKVPTANLYNVAYSESDPTNPTKSRLTIYVGRTTSTSNQVLVQMSNASVGGNILVFLSKAGKITDGNWHHVLVNITGSGAGALYIDGIVVDSGAMIGSFQHSLPAPTIATIGAAQTGSLTDFFNGSLDDVRTYNHALTSAEVARLANGFQDPDTGTGSSTYSGSEGSPITFHGGGNGGATPYTFSWNFGDGTTGTGASPVHTYDKHGSYTATLTVTDAHALTATATAPVTISDVAPTPNSHGPYTGVTGTPVTFTGTATDPSQSDTASGFTFHWTFGDGNSATGSSVTHTYSSTGSYAVTLKATEKTGLSTTVSTTATITTANGPPAADAGSNQTVNEGTALTLTGSVSGGNSPFTYLWTFGDGTSSGSKIAIHRFDKHGLYTATFKVTDALSRVSTGSTVITVTDVAPTPNAHGPYSAASGTSISFTGTATDPSNTDTASGFTFHWDFGDGNTSTTASPNHLYTQTGTYVITLTATEKSGLVGTTTTTATITTAGGYAVHTDATRSVNEGTPLTLTGTVTGGTAPYVYSWTFGDGTSSGSLTALHRYDKHGTYTATLTVTDAQSLQTSSTIIVTVKDVAPTPNLHGPYAALVGSGITFSGSGSDPSHSDTASGFTLVWNFGDGQSATGAVVTHTYSQSGSYTVILKAIEKSGLVGSGSTTAAITAGEALLDASDFTYEGAIKVSGGILSGSPEGLAYRRSTNTWFTIADYGLGPSNIYPSGYELVELSFPAPSLTEAGASNATVVKDWGTLNVNGALNLSGGQLYMKGLLWDETGSKLWFTMGSYYPAGANNNVLGYATLDTGTPVVHGPWKVAVGSDLAKGMLIEAPPEMQAITHQRFLMYGISGNTNQKQSWGTGLVSVAEPTSSDATGSSLASEKLIHWPMHVYPAYLGKFGYAHSDFRRLPMDNDNTMIQGNDNVGQVNSKGSAQGGTANTITLNAAENYSSSSTTFGYQTLSGWYVTNLDTNEQLQIVAWDNVTKIATVKGGWTKGVPVSGTNYSLYFPTYQLNNIILPDGTFRDTDFVDHGVWIDLPKKHGLLYFGGVAAGYSWYGNPYAHSDPTPTGAFYDNNMTSMLHPGQPLQPDTTSRGWHAERSDLRWYVVDPDAVLMVAAKAMAGTATDQDLEIPWSNGGDAKMLGGNVQLNDLTHKMTFGESYWDAADGLLYTLSPEGTSTNTGIINVWKVQ